MNAIKSIEQKSFIQDLEWNLKFEHKMTYENFKSQIWNLLCSLPVRHKIRLANQLNFEQGEKRTNIGNINYYIIKRLGVEFMEN